MSQPTRLRAASVLGAAIALGSCGASACDVVLGIGDLPVVVLAPDVSSDVSGDTLGDDVGVDACGAACECPAPTPGELHVSPNGSDDATRAVRGSSACPFKTVTRAIAQAEHSVIATTIVLHHVGGLPATYGDDCSGGAPCDAMPLVVPSSIGVALEIAGDGAPDQVIVTGVSGFSVHASAVGFSKMTVAPTGAPGADGSNGYGIQYESDVALPPAGVLGSSIHDLVVTGSLPAGGAGTGNALAIRGSAGLKVGPNVTLERARHAIFHGGHGELVVAGVPGAPIRIGPTAFDCILVTSTLDDPPTVSLDQIDVGPCGVVAAGTAALTIDTRVEGESHASHVTATKLGTTNPRFAGVLLKGGAMLTLEDGDFAIRDEALVILDSASLVARRVSIHSEIDGVRLTTLGSVSLELATIVGNGGNGVRCNAAKLAMRDCSAYANAASGVLIGADCAVDLGTELSPGGNVFDKSSSPNAEAGLCFLEPRTLTFHGATFGCGYAGPGCMAGTPTTVFRDGACAVADVSVGVGGSITALESSCCK